MLQLPNFWCHLTQWESYKKWLDDYIEETLKFWTFSDFSEIRNQKEQKEKKISPNEILTVKMYKYGNSTTLHNRIFVHSLRHHRPYIHISLFKWGDSEPREPEWIEKTNKFAPPALRMMIVAKIFFIIIVVASWETEMM